MENEIDLFPRSLTTIEDIIRDPKTIDFGNNNVYNIGGEGTGNVKYNESQSLTLAEKYQARLNIGFPNFFYTGAKNYSIVSSAGSTDLTFTPIVAGAEGNSVFEPHHILFIDNQNSTGVRNLNITDPSLSTCDVFINIIGTQSFGVNITTVDGVITLNTGDYVQLKLIGAYLYLVGGNLAGAGGSDENYTTAEKSKLSGIAAGAEVNVNADWNAVSGDAFIQNKPTIPSIAGLASTSYVDAADNLKVDKVAGERLINAAEITKLGNQSGTNTGDQDLSGKVDKVVGKSLIDDTEISRLVSMTGIFTSALKTAYDSAVTWISTNSTALLAHLSLTNNPHSVTKTQVGLGNADNTSDANKPISTATQTALNEKEPTKGLDDNYVTDAEKVVIGNTSGTNTGDNATNSLYSGLATSKENTITGGTTAQYWRGDKSFQTLDKTAVGLGNVPNLAFSGSNTGDETTGTIQSKRPLKTVNGNSLEGSGDVTVSGGGGGSDISIAHIIALG